MIIQDIGGSELFIRYRDKNNNLIEKKERFTPYYWQLERTEHRSMLNYDGKKIYQQFYSNPRDKNKIRDSKLTYELDVSLENRYLIDKYEKLPEWKPRIMHLDIETKMCLDSIRTPEPITAITMYDSYENTYVTLSWKEEKGYQGTFIEDNIVTIICFSEKEMLNQFKKIFIKYDPDLITGWNVLNFDIAYIINRHIILGMPIKWISPVNQIESEIDEHHRNPIRGRIVFDLKAGYEKLHDGAIGYTALRDVLIDNNAPIRKLTGLDSYESDFVAFLKYNLRDVEGTVWIDNEFDIIQSFIERQNLVGGKFSDTFYNKDVIDCAFLRYAHKKNIVLPTAKRLTEDVSYEGATIYKPITGFHKNVIVLDVKSMYPSSMEAANMSFETIVSCAEKFDEKYLVKLGNGVTFYKGFEGFTVDLLHEIQDYREVNKSLMKQYEEGSSEYRKYDNKQRVAKFLKNSLYGVFGFKSFRLYNIDIARSITWLSRQAIAHIRSTVEHEFPECKVIYGHTDSVFVQTPDVSMAKEIQDTINSSWGKFEKKYNLVPGKYEIEVDKIFSGLVLAGANMYAGRLTNGKLVVKGFALRKKSTAPIVKDLQGNVINMILDEIPEEEIFRYIKDIVSMIRNGECSLEEITIKCKIKQPLGSYKTTPMHISAARWSNEHCGTEYKSGDMIKLLAVKNDYNSIINKVPKNNVVAFEDINSMYRFNVDFELMVDKLIPGKIRLIAQALDWDLEELMKDDKKKK